MFWAIITLSAIAYTFTRLGALAVVAKVMTAALVCAAFLIVALAVALLWRAKLSKKAG